MAVKLTKNEQKKQKDALKQYERYLPTLLLKKQQLQMVIRQIEAEADKVKKQKEELVKSLERWVAVFNENVTFPERHRMEDLVQIDSVKKGVGNIAGVTIPVFEEIKFKPIAYDFGAYPLWVDAGITALKEIAELDARNSTLSRQVYLLEKELLTTSQRVNLFEKVKIPEAKENIRKIGICLGDQQTSAVVRGKIAKNKLLKVQPL
ncbi:MAG: V-type ATP synthase subunit D [Sphaerochaetaceae bacterium]|jgi:V/A-type H+-transporting ATPase subunit D|nr:V-type ATP synthase subunit D [Sphaerochaetaceae bacterium]